MHPTDRLSIAQAQGEIGLSFDAPCLALRAQPGDFWNDFSELDALQSFKPSYDRLVASGVESKSEIGFGYASAIVQITRFKSETRALIAAALAALAPNGLLVLDGSKTDGIDSHIKALKKLISFENIYSKAHGKTACATRPDEIPQEILDWAKDDVISKTADGYHTRPGLFSADGLDPGTAFLLENLPKIKGSGADFGAGWGGLATEVLTNNSEITSLALFEAENRALECAKLNISDPRAAFIWQDIQKLPAKREFDFVISNPPFHTGRAADSKLGISFLEKASSTLLPNGQLWIVANRQLPYEEPLGRLFRVNQTIAQNNQFKILHARQPLKRR